MGGCVSSHKPTPYNSESPEDDTGTISKGASCPQGVLTHMCLQEGVRLRSAYRTALPINRYELQSKVRWLDGIMEDIETWVV